MRIQQFAYAKIKLSVCGVGSLAEVQMYLYAASDLESLLSTRGNLV